MKPLPVGFVSLLTDNVSSSDGLKHKVSGGCHEDYGKYHANHVDGRYRFNSFLKHLNLCELFISGLAFDLRTELPKFGIATPKYRAKHKGDETEDSANAKAYPCA